MKKLLCIALLSISVAVVAQTFSSGQVLTATALNTALAQKANVTDVNSALALKANATDLAGSSITLGSTTVRLGVAVPAVTGLTLNSPNLVAPALGTPSSGTATNLAGTALNLTAGYANSVPSLATPAGSASVGTQQSGTGAVTRTVQSKVNDTVSSSDYATGTQAVAAIGTGTLKVPNGASVTLPSSYPGVVVDYGSQTAHNVYSESDTNRLTSRLLRSQYGTHTGTQQVAVFGIENRPTGSGANGAANSDMGQNISVIKHNYLTSTQQGEIDGLNVVVRQGGPTGNGSTTNSDAAGILIDAGMLTGSGWAGALEASTSIFNSSGTVIKQLQTQVGVLDTTTNNHIGFAAIAGNGEINDGLRLLSSGTGYYDNFLSFFNTGGTKVFQVNNSGNITLRANSGVTPSKTIRSLSGQLSVLNDAQTAQIFVLDDVGNVNLGGGISTTGAVNAPYINGASPNLFGTFANATGASIISGCGTCVPQVTGFTAPSQVATYTSRDTVALYASNQDKSPTLTLTSPTYDATHVYPATPLTSAQVASVRIGVFIETNASPKYTGTVTAVASNGSSITVSGWFQSGNTSSGQVATGSAAYVDIVTDVFAANFDVTYNGSYTQGVGAHTMELDMVQTTPFVQGNVFTTAGETPVSNILQIACDAGTCGSGIDIYGPNARGILVQSAATAGYIFAPSSGTGFLSGQTSGEAFVVKNPVSYITTASISGPSTLNLGTQSGGAPTAPNIELFSSALGAQDATITSSGGTSSANHGNIQLIGATTQIYGPSTSAGDNLIITPNAAGSGVTVSVNSPGSNAPLNFASKGTGSINLQATTTNANQIAATSIINTGATTNTAVSAGMEHGSTTTAGTPYIDWHSSGNNNDYDVRLVASGGTSNGTGTLNVIGAGFQVNSVPVMGNLTGTTSSIGGSALAVGACSSGTVTVSGATTSMVVDVAPSTYPGDPYYYRGYVSSAGTVTVKVCAMVAGTPTASPYNVRVIQ